MMDKIKKGLDEVKSKISPSKKPKVNKGLNPKFQKAKPGDRPLKNMINGVRKGQAQKATGSKTVKVKK